MLSKYFLLVLGGFGGGALVATGLFALITMLGLVNRFAQNTKTAVDIMWYEESVIWGATIGSLILVFDIQVKVGIIGLAIFGLLGGIYAGCLAVALAETVKSFPIMLKRFRLNEGIGAIILALALGKSIGSLIYFFLLNYKSY